MADRRQPRHGRFRIEADLRGGIYVLRVGVEVGSIDGPHLHRKACLVRTRSVMREAQDAAEPTLLRGIPYQEIEGSLD